MSTAIMIRVRAENYESWFREHSGQETARRDYGITDGPFYRDAQDPSSALVHLDVENLEKAMTWFKSDAFQAAAKRVVGAVQREIWIAQRKTPSARTQEPAGAGR